MVQTALDKLAGDLGLTLQKLNAKLTTAESCTGGGVAYAITSIPRSSEWFDRGFVTYSNQSKMDMLDVKPETLKKYGAVSEETAREMADGALKHSGADISVAITGIAGPDGGTKEKPVGTVWLAWARKDHETSASLFLLEGDRHTIRENTVIEALHGLLIVMCR